MLRKLNFTERVRIPKSDFRVTLRRDRDGILVFDPMLDLSSIEGLGDAKVCIEAWHQSSFMRFDCGRISDLELPRDRRLTEMDGPSVRFRVKIVDDDHRILAVADDIRVTEGGEGSSRVPLLPVQFSDALGQVPWRIIFEPDSPLLELNNSIDGIEQMAKEDLAFFAFVYPAAVREILTQILLVDKHEAFEDPDDWWSRWIRWASSLTTDPLPSDVDDARQWIEDVVAAFCGAHRTVERLQGSEDEPA